MMRSMTGGAMLRTITVVLLLVVTCLTLFSCNQTHVERGVSYKEDISDLVIYDQHGD